MSTELYHHGIKGQKWGHRRYQNPDGTLTPEGKSRYYKSVNKSANIGAVIGLASGLGEVGLAVATAAALGTLSVSAIPTAAVLYGAKYAASGYLTGYAVGAIKTSIDVRRGRKYVQENM